MTFTCFCVEFTIMSVKGKIPPKMELFRTDQYYIFINGEYGLWWNRTTGEFEAKSGGSLPLCHDCVN